jgi:hypothetical protein
MKRKLALIMFSLSACQSTRPPKFRRERVQLVSPDSLAPEEKVWLRRATGLHAFMRDYYQNPRNFKARSVIGLSEMQRVIMRNRSEPWQPHLADRGIRISWLLSPEMGASAYQWTFSTGWRNLIQERSLNLRRNWIGPEGLSLWILPTEQYKNQLKPEDHVWLRSIGIVATDPNGDFEADEDTLRKKLAVDESGVYLQAELEDQVNVKNRISIVINDVAPIYVDSSHRFLNRALAVLRASDFVRTQEKNPAADASLIAEVKKQLVQEAQGKGDAINWLDKNFVQSDLLNGGASEYGFAGLWDAYLKGLVQVINVPGLEYQADPEFLSHLDRFAEIYLGKPPAALSRSPADVNGNPSALSDPSVTHRVIGLEFDESGPVLGLF